MCAAAAPVPAVSRPALAGKKLLAPRKPSAKVGGLGVKKLVTKVDNSLFEQAPAAAPAPVPVGPSGAFPQESEPLLSPHPRP